MKERFEPAGHTRGDGIGPARKGWGTKVLSYSSLLLSEACEA